jgi:hypothetical protein
METMFSLKNILKFRIEIAIVCSKLSILGKKFQKREKVLFLQISRLASSHLSSLCAHVYYLYRKK